MYNWKNKKTERLFKAFLSLETVDEIAAFCRDLMTEPEINEFASRLEVASLLDEGKSQRQVSAESGVSIATVTRVNQWLSRGMNGYKLVLNRLNADKSVISKVFSSFAPTKKFSHHHPH